MKEMIFVSGQENLTLLSLRHPGGVVSATMTIDPESHLPERCQWISSGQENFIELNQWEETEGFLFPRELHLSVEAEQTILRVHTVRPVEGRVQHRCRMVTARPQDTRFNANQTRAVELKRIPSGNLAVHPLVNGEDVGWFLLDTGAGRSVIDLKIADDLGMVAVGELAAMGIGGLVTVHYRKGEQLTLGPVEIIRPTFVEVDLSPLAKAFGLDISGILGYDLFMRCLAELDVQGDSLLLFEPGTWNGRKANWEEIIFNRNAPVLSCSFNGDQSGLFLLDTGFPGTLTFSKSFAEKYHLLEEQELKTGLATGVGGTLETLSGQMEWFEIGGYRLPEVGMSIAGERRGVLSDEAIAGLVGTGLLSSFRMLIDYPNKRIAFVNK
jgi:predicted aspartyl protease